MADKNINEVTNLTVNEAIPFFKKLSSSSHNTTLTDREQKISKQILKDAADNNISDKSKGDLDKLVEQYKIDLYTNLYIEKVVSSSLDTLVSEQEIKVLYDETRLF